MESSDTLEELTTTTVCDASLFMKFLLCCSSSVPLGKFHLVDRSLTSPDTLPVLNFTPGFIRDANKVRSMRNSRMLRHVAELCRTPRLDSSIIARCIPSKYSDVMELTCGGMSRIYTAHTENTEVIIKVTDCSRGLGVYEYQSYKLLRRAGFSVPPIYYVAMYGKFLIMIMPRLTFSLASLYLTFAERGRQEDEPLFDAVHQSVSYMLNALRAKKIAVNDFSPDNVMVQIDSKTLQGKLVLIDPQFTLPMRELSMGRGWVENIDRVHFAYKVMALAMQDTRMFPIAKRICTEYLGFVPTAKGTKRWILNVLPYGLRIAYDSIDKTSSQNKDMSRGFYGAKNIVSDAEV